MSASVFQKAFNNHFDEFVADLLCVFPNNKDILTAQNALSLLRQGNPKILINLWNKHIVSKYAEQIEAGDINFFIHKDYNEDIQDNSSTIMVYIDKFRQPVSEMSQEDQEKCMTYFKNLTGLAKKYFQAK
jgi:hypothetical protein